MKAFLADFMIYCHWAYRFCGPMEYAGLIQACELNRITYSCLYLFHSSFPLVATWRARVWVNRRLLRDGFRFMGSGNGVVD